MSLKTRSLRRVFTGGACKNPASSSRDHAEEFQERLGDEIDYHETNAVTNEVLQVLRLSLLCSKLVSPNLL